MHLYSVKVGFAQSFFCCLVFPPKAMSGEIGTRLPAKVSEEDILRGLFQKCDASYNTGQVRAQDLLSALKVESASVEWLFFN